MENLRVNFIPSEAQKKCRLCSKIKALGCYYSKGRRRDSRCKDCIKEQKAKVRKKLRTTKKCKNVWDFTIEEREIPMSENAHYRQKLLKQILTDLALDTFAKYHIL